MVSGHFLMYVTMFSFYNVIPIKLLLSIVMHLMPYFCNLYKYKCIVTTTGNINIRIIMIIIYLHRFMKVHMELVTERILHIKVD